MLEVRNNIVRCLDELGQTAGENSARDRFLAGYIAACKDFLDIQPEE